MEQRDRRRRSPRPVPIGRLAAAALSIGALSGAVIGAGPASASSKRTAMSISTAKDAKLGTILVSGNTVYTLKPSSKPCTAKCLKVWPEVLLPKGVKKASAGPGVKASKLGTVKRHGGVLQVTYGGKPLYWYVKDTAPGQVRGNFTDTWGKWSTVVTAKAGGSNNAGSAGSNNGGSGGSNNGGSGGSNNGGGGSSAGTGGVSF